MCDFLICSQKLQPLSYTKLQHCVTSRSSAHLHLSFFLQKTGDSLLLWNLDQVSIPTFTENHKERKNHCDSFCLSPRAVQPLPLSCPASPPGLSSLSPRAVQPLPQSCPACSWRATALQAQPTLS